MNARALPIALPNPTNRMAHRRAEQTGSVSAIRAAARPTQTASHAKNVLWTDVSCSAEHCHGPSRMD